MASNPITMKRDGSGSLAQKLAAYLNPPPSARDGTAYRGLVDAYGNLNQDTIAAGIVIFVVARGQPVYANDRDGTTELGAWCARHGISGKEYEHLDASIGSYISRSYATACIPLFSPTCILCSGPNGRLLVRAGALMCRVGHEWRREYFQAVDMPPTASVEAFTSGIRVSLGVAGMLDVREKNWQARLFLEGENGLVDLPERQGVYIPWGNGWSPTIHGATILNSEGAETGAADVLVVDNYDRYGNDSCIGDLSRVLQYTAFQPSYTNTGTYHYCPNFVGDELPKAGSFSEIVSFLKTLVTNFPDSAILPNPVDAGKAWRAGTYKFEGKSAAIVSHARPYLLTDGAVSTDWPYWITIGTCPTGLMGNPTWREAEKVRINNLSPNLGGSQTMEVSIARNDRLPYKICVAEGGTLLGVKLRVTASTGSSSSPGHRLPGDSHIIVAVASSAAFVGFGNQSDEVPCTLDHSETRTVGSGDEAREMTIHFYRIEAGDYFEKDGEGRLASMQTRTFVISCDSDSPYSGIFLCRPGVDIAAAWNADPDILPSFGEPVFDEWEEADPYVEDQ